MIKLVDLILADILPERLKTKEILAVAAVLDKQMKEITQEIDSVTMIPWIDEMPEDIVDSLAWQFHVDFYEPLGLNLDLKRALVKNSLDWHRRKGTRSALEEMIRLLFFRNFAIEEWFEYGGKPYFFRLISWDALREKEQYNDLIRAIYELKNERSWLEGLTFHREAEGTVYVGTVGRYTTHFEVDAFAPESKLEDITVHFGIVGRHTTKFQVIGTYPEESKSQPADTFWSFAGRRTKHFAVDGEGAELKFAPANAYVGMAGKMSLRSIIEAEDVATNVPNTQVNAGMAHRHISKTFIDSEEVENGYI